MKYIYSLVLISFILSSCGNDKNQSIENIIATNNLELIRKKKTELDASAQEISAQLKQLEAKIKVLDPLEKIPLITTFQVKEAVLHIM